MARGAQIESGLRFEADITDIAPTILTLLGLAVPADMDGKVMTGIFREVPKIRFSEAEDSDKTCREDSPYSVQEEKEISRDLANLGYID